MKKKFPTLSAMIFCAAFCAPSFSEELSAKKIADNAVSKNSPQEAVEYVSAKAEKITAPRYARDNRSGCG